MSIRMKTILAFSMIFAIMIGVFAYQFVKQGEHIEELEQLDQVTMKNSMMIDDIRYYVAQVQQYLTDVSATRGGNGADDGLAEAEKNARLFRGTSDAYLKNDPEQKERMDQLKTSFENYYVIGQDMAKAYIDGDAFSGAALMERFDEAADGLQSTIATMRSESVHDTTEAIAAIRDANESNRQLLTVASIAAVLVGMAIALWLSYIIIGPVRRLMKQAELIAGGDLSTPTPIRSKDEIGRLAQSFEQMRLNLAGLLREVSGSIEYLTRSINEVSESTQQTIQSVQEVTEATQEVAAGADEQMKGAQEAARSTEELAAGIGRIAEASTVVSELSANTERQAKQGGETVRETAEQMDVIRAVVNRFADSVRLLDEHSRSIEEFVGVIQKITNQTNILALNAGIEAARAGENGKGFAVVANEIRKLAEQTNASSSQISAMVESIRKETTDTVAQIETGLREVELGRDKMGETNRTFNDIMEATVRVSDQLREVSAATEQMAASSQEVGATVAHLSEIANRSLARSETVAAGSEEQMASFEEIAATLDSIRELSAKLSEMTSKFKYE